MNGCAISFKECWMDDAGDWLTDGGFPLQMNAIASLFDSFELLVVGVQPRPGGTPLSRELHVIPMRRPFGEDFRRKLAVLSGLPYYLPLIARQVRCADVVHVPLPGDIPLVGLLVGVLLRKRVIARYCSSWATTSQTTVMNRLTKALLRVLAGGKVVTFATGATELPAKVRSIFATALLRAEIDSIQPALDRALSSPPRLVYIGRLAREKGVANLLAALDLLKRRNFEPLPVLSLVGDGPERVVLEQLVRQYDCEDRVRFHGQVNRTELRECLSSADICVQPSLTEGFSKAWLDAMAHGLPVLATDVGAAREVIGVQGDRGWLVPPRDVESLAGGLRQVLSDTRDWRLLRRACRTYAEMHTLENWRVQIAEACADQWRLSIVAGKLRPANAVG
jgi:glycosyltransferase involved in cell wall biosynthesis